MGRPVQIRSAPWRRTTCCMPNLLKAHPMIRWPGFIWATEHKFTLFTDMSKNGLRQSAGAVVIYEYDLTLIEQNHERVIQQGIVSTAPGISTNPARTIRKQVPGPVGP